MLKSHQSFKAVWDVRTTGSHIVVWQRNIKNPVQFLTIVFLVVEQSGRRILPLQTSSQPATTTTSGSKRSTSTVLFHSLAINRASRLSESKVPESPGEYSSQNTAQGWAGDFPYISSAHHYTLYYIMSNAKSREISEVYQLLAVSSMNVGFYIRDNTNRRAHHWTLTTAPTVTTQH